MIPVLDARQMRAADNRAIRSGIPAEHLMENAAAGLVGSLQEQYPGWRRVVVACGPGNNGGDGLAAARMLARGGISVSIFTLRDPESYTGPAAANAERARAAGLELLRLSGPRAALEFRRALDDSDGVVDALFGTGLTRALTGAGARAVDAINRAGREVVAADVPSGLSSDTGELIGAAVRARLTVAFAAAKHCHAFYPARERCGRLRVVPIGIPRRLLVSLAVRISLVEAADLRRLLPPRSPDSHKGDFGRVAIIAGSRGKAGAAILAARGALRAGAGLVTVLCPERLEDVVVAALPEAMTRGLPEQEGAVAAAGAAAALEALEECDAAVVGPGLSSDTGELIGAAVRARLTVAFAAAKHCHAFYPARERCGRLRVVPIGIPRRLLVSRAARISLVEAADLRRLLPPRSPNSHKGDFGRVAIIAGSRGKAGAAILAARGALRAGAGLVTVLCPERLEDVVVAALPEAMTRGLPEQEGAVAAAGAAAALEALEECDAAVVGPGLGTAPTTVAFLRKLLTSAAPLVCDADALNAFAGHPAAFARRRRPTVLTPHPGEAGRLLGTDSRRVQRDRSGAARRLARRTRSIVLLKGAASLTANPAGQIRVNPTGSPLMSSAGSGDVLTGAIAALLAAGLDAEEAAYCGAFLHGAAGERLESTLGDAGLLAHELADALPFARDSLRGSR